MWRSIFFKKFNFIFKKTHKIFINRSSIIPKSLINEYIIIYKGNVFKKLYVTKYNIGYKLGEFSFTRKPFYYPMKEKNKKRKR